MEDAGGLIGPSLAVLRLMGLWRPAAASGGACGGAAASLPGAISCVAIGLLSLCCASKLFIDTPTELTELTVCAYLFVIITANFVKVMIVVSSIAWLFVTVPFRVFTAGSTNIDWPTPIPIWLPIDMQLSPTYELIYLGQVLCAVATAGAMLGVDTLFFHLTLMIVAELQVLNDNISMVGRVASPDEKEVFFRVKDAGEQQQNFSDVINNGQNEGGVSLSNPQATITEKNYSDLIEIIQHHQIIIKMVGLLQTIMDYSVSVLLLTNVLDVCFLIFTMSELLHNEKSLHAVLQTILSLPCLLCESGAFCMFGQMIIDQSENLVHAGFSCEWLHADICFRKPLLKFMLMASHPLQIKLGGTAKLSRSTFLQALNGSYTLINLLYHSRRPEG
ncbi:odorant receptor 43a-like [Schistocerca nitens]|uniref:odorant receptor 43a-like n=1 Tax=Schistocerca nitens TaxID=7011 RepID=UPI0021180773|nr:odorant receptor 43a-like [Schistocerca nitens]